MARDSSGSAEARETPVPATEGADKTPQSDSTALTAYGKTYELIGQQGIGREQLNSEQRYQREWREHETQDWPNPGAQEPRSRETMAEGDRGSDRDGERVPDPEGSWRGAECGRYLSPEQNAEVDTRYGQLAECSDRYGEGVQQVAEGAGGATAGYEFRLKGADRLKDKIVTRLEEDPGLSVGDAMSEIADAVRYTIQIPDASYTDGVDRSVADMRSRGFQLTDEGWRNSWDNDVYRGINSRWRDPENGQIFEVQFHTPDSLYAKEVTHQAYERARLPGLEHEELEEIDRIQANVTTTVSAPVGAVELHYEPDRNHHDD